MNAVITTAASTLFFPWLLNLIGSIQKNYPDHPPIVVYDLGLLPAMVYELSCIRKVSVRKIPHFCDFWRECYTWKLWIYTQPLATLNLHIDAGAIVLRPLTEMFALINREGYCAINQGPLGELIPRDYYKTLAIPRSLAYKQAFTAGIFGYKSTGQNKKIIAQAFALGLQGYGLGYSITDARHLQRSQRRFPIRYCRYFRHDQTLLNIAFHHALPEMHILPVEKYAGWQTAQDHPEQLIFNCRKNNDDWVYWRQVDYRTRAWWFSVQHAVFLIYRGIKRLKQRMRRTV